MTKPFLIDFSLFYLPTVGGQYSSEMIATTVGVTLIISIPLSKVIQFQRISSTKKQIIISTVAIVLCMMLLAVLCVTEGSLGHKLEFEGRDMVPVVIFCTVAFFYVAGISRNCLLIMQQILSSYSLQLHLRTLSIAIAWFFIFAMTKLLPQLLYLVGVGYFYSYMVILTIPTLIFLCRIIPSSLNLEVCKATPSWMETSLSASSTSSEAPSTSPLPTCPSSEEPCEVEEI